MCKKWYEMKTTDNRNQEQFIRLLMMNDKSIYAYILSFVSNTNDADDIMQETSAVLWRKFGEFKPDMAFVPWALTIARYQVLSFFKKRKRSKVVFNDELMNTIKEGVEKKLPHMDDHFDALKNCIKKLNHADQTLVKLRYENGYTFENIGAHISKSTRAAFYSLSRIHQLLMQCIKRTLNNEAF